MRGFFLQGGPASAGKATDLNVSGLKGGKAEGKKDVRRGKNCLDEQKRGVR